MRNYSPSDKCLVAIMALCEMRMIDRYQPQSKKTERNSAGIASQERAGFTTKTPGSRPQLHKIIFPAASAEFLIIILQTHYFNDNYHHRWPQSINISGLERFFKYSLIGAKWAKTNSFRCFRPNKPVASRIRRWPYKASRSHREPNLCGNWTRLIRGIDALFAQEKHTCANPEICMRGPVSGRFGGALLSGPIYDQDEIEILPRHRRISDFERGATDSYCHLRKLD
ncbi:hypothetical protein TcasGA2_TC013950 [Tribolium castaneum]|uniref:Uncharacterized protein n=1 Tax=Tribolium castaneum TaxID=7070 RepID=D6WNQ0_TRICA|nr:hypothetical protein TcasGA2_TC013950 [Tribolium castaneum]